MANDDWRKHEYYSYDPFQDIHPALLNSYDIKRYVDKGCLIEKSNFDDRRLKTASYELRFLGELHYWGSDDDGKFKRKNIPVCDNTPVTIPKNSITYLWIKENLLLPEYIAARFNLHIRHVHKGILLGTGPLVDPGFFGRILIPLHNLTDNDYELEGGEGIIWVEFTKVSTNEFWSTPDTHTKQRPSFLREFPKSKDIYNPERYLEKSDVIKEGGVQSAFQGALDDARNSARDAQNSANRFKRLITIGGSIAIVGLIIGFAALIYQGYAFMNQFVDSIQAQNIKQGQLNRNEQLRYIHDNRDKIDLIENRMKLYEIEVENMKIEMGSSSKKRMTRRSP